MRRMLGTIMIAALLFVGTTAHVALGTGETQFDKYLGKYPSDLFKAEPDVRRRLQALLGDDYAFFMERLETETPFRAFKGILFAKGCKAHECTIEEAILLIDLSDGALHCAIHSDTYRSKIETFSENPAHFPTAALDYALDQ
jgi:hypothetical protein